MQQTHAQETTPSINPEAQKLIEDMVARYNKLKSYSDNPTSLAIRFVLQHPAISSAVIGVRTTEQLKEALDVNMLEPLPENIYSELKEISSLNYYTDHR